MIRNPGVMHACLLQSKQPTKTDSGLHTATGRIFRCIAVRMAARLVQPGDKPKRVAGSQEKAESGKVGRLAADVVYGHDDDCSEQRP